MGVNNVKNCEEKCEETYEQMCGRSVGEVAACLLPVSPPLLADVFFSLMRCHIGQAGADRTCMCTRRTTAAIVAATAAAMTEFMLIALLLLLLLLLLLPDLPPVVQAQAAQVRHQVH